MHYLNRKQKERIFLTPFKLSLHNENKKKTPFRIHLILTWIRSAAVIKLDPDPAKLSGSGSETLGEATIKKQILSMSPDIYLL